MIQIGRRNKVIALQKHTRVNTAEGFEDTWATYATARAAVEPATPVFIERLVGATVTTPVSHLVTIPYRESRDDPQDDPGPSGKIHTADRVWFRNRALYIAGMQNPHENNRTLILACQEREA